MTVRALVIDDSRAMRRIVSGILIGLGYEVRDAGHLELTARPFLE